MNNTLSNARRLHYIYCFLAYYPLEISFYKPAATIHRHMLCVILKIKDLKSIYIYIARHIAISFIVLMYINPFPYGNICLYGSFRALNSSNNALNRFFIVILSFMVENILKLYKEQHDYKIFIQEPL